MNTGTKRRAEGGGFAVCFNKLPNPNRYDVEMNKYSLQTNRTLCQSIIAR